MYRALTTSSVCCSLSGVGGNLMRDITDEEREAMPPMDTTDYPREAAGRDRKRGVNLRDLALAAVAPAAAAISLIQVRRHAEQEIGPDKDVSR